LMDYWAVLNNVITEENKKANARHS
jgi:hypothetical protein